MWNASPGQDVRCTLRKHRAEGEGDAKAHIWSRRRRSGHQPGRVLRLDRARHRRAPQLCGPASPWHCERWASIFVLRAWGSVEAPQQDVRTPTRNWPAGASGPISERVSGLTEATDYRYRLCGNDAGKAAVCANTRSFTTPGPDGVDSVIGFWRAGFGADPTGGSVRAIRDTDGSNPRGSLSITTIAQPDPGEPFQEHRFTGFVTCLRIEGVRATIGAVGADQVDGGPDTPYTVRRELQGRTHAAMESDTPPAPARLRPAAALIARSLSDTPSPASPSPTTSGTSSPRIAINLPVVLAAHNVIHRTTASRAPLSTARPATSRLGWRSARSSRVPFRPRSTSAEGRLA